MTATIEDTATEERPEGRFFQSLPQGIRELLVCQKWPGAKVVDLKSGLAGEVYFIDQGAHVGTRWIVAKTPLGKGDAAEATRRFIRELVLQRGLFHHQSVHWPFDVAMVHDAPVAWFRAWDLDLTAWLSRPDFSRAGRLAFLVYLAEGLLHCHARGLDAHQDLKPENIFVRDRRAELAGRPGQEVGVMPMIGDFGSGNLGRLIGEYGGTAAYMAPEQWRQEPLTSKTSVWSLGVIGYELLSGGRHPLGKPIRNSEGKISKSRSSWKAQAGAFDPPKLDDDPHLDAIIRSCLASDPAMRPELSDLRDDFLRELGRVKPILRTQAECVMGSPYARSAEDWADLDARFDIFRQQAAEIFGPQVLDPPVRE